MNNTDLTTYLSERYNLNTNAVADYFYYLIERDNATTLRVKGLQHQHEYFVKHPSCQNRRYMDRESQYFIQDRLQYKGKYPVTDALFHLIFRKASTYRTMRDLLGDYPGNLLGKYQTNLVIKLLKEIETPFTGAYLVPHRDKEQPTKIEGWLQLFNHLYNFEVIQKASYAKDVYKLFYTIRSMGDFLAMQFTTELGWLDCTKYGGNEFVIPGNGAVRGMTKLGLSKSQFNDFLFALVVHQPIKSNTCYQ